MSCSPDDVTPTTPVDDTPVNKMTATLLKQGVLMGVNHTASGTASIYEDNGNKIIFFDPFMSENGPDLKVYLSKDQKASEYIRLGQLKSTNGSQSYQIPAGTEISQYQFVHIWCEKYSVEFGGKFWRVEGNG